MNTEEKAKAYDEALEKVRPLYEQAKKDGNPIWSTYEHLFPQLHESEDERIREEIISALKFANDGGVYDKHIAYLEKKKENPKSSDSISSDCTSDAKYENWWHKTANYLPDNGRDVLAKDALGNYLLASFDGAQWFVSVYDGEDHPVLHTPPILEWCEIPSEKQKDHFRDDTKKVEQKPVNLLNTLLSKDPHLPKQAVKYEQKPVEWDDAKELVFKDICNHLQAEGYGGWVILLNALRNGEFQPNPTWCEADEEMLVRLLDSISIGNDYKEMCNWLLPKLRSLRPKPYWKPSEEQMKGLKFFLDFHRSQRNAGTTNWREYDAVESLYKQLQKLM